MSAREAIKLVANNKKAYHDYFIEEKYEAGIELFGTEVKSIRQGKCSIKEAYVTIDHGEAFVEGMNISPYEKGNIFNREPLRKRRCLFRSTSRTDASRWRSVLREARSSTTRETTSRKRQ